MKYQPGQIVWWLCPFPRQLLEVVINRHQPCSVLKSWDVKLNGKTLYALESELFADEEEGVKERDNTYFQPGQIVWWLCPFAQQVYPVAVVRWVRYSTISFSGHWEVEDLSHGEKIGALRSELFPCREGAYTKLHERYPKREKEYR